MVLCTKLAVIVLLLLAVVGDISAAGLCGQGSELPPLTSFLVKHRPCMCHHGGWQHTGDTGGGSTRGVISQPRAAPFLPLALDLALVNVGELTVTFIFGKKRNVEVRLTDPEGTVGVPLDTVTDRVISVVVSATARESGTPVSITVVSLRACKLPSAVTFEPTTTPTPPPTTTTTAEPTTTTTETPEAPQYAPDPAPQPMVARMRLAPTPPTTTTPEPTPPPAPTTTTPEPTPPPPTTTEPAPAPAPTTTTPEPPAPPPPTTTTPEPTTTTTPEPTTTTPEPTTTTPEPTTTTPEPTTTTPEPTTTTPEPTTTTPEPTTTTTPKPTTTTPEPTTTTPEPTTTTPEPTTTTPEPTTTTPEPTTTTPEPTTTTPEPTTTTPDPTTTTTPKPTPAPGASSALDVLLAADGGLAVDACRATGGCATVPWLVRVVDSTNSTRCTGVILDQHRVITTADCIKPIGDATWTVLAGDHDSSLSEPAKQTRTVALSDVTKYTPQGTNLYGLQTNNVAVVKLSPPLDMGQACVAAAALDPSVTFSNRNCSYAGWDKTAATTSGTSGGVQVCRVEPVRGADCRESFGLNFFGFISNPLNQTCIKGASVANGCVMELGTPLVCRDDATGRHVLVALGSYGNGCLVSPFPYVMSTIALFHDFIQQELAKGN